MSQNPWFPHPYHNMEMITSAEITLSGNKARLSKHGKDFFLEIQSPPNAYFTIKRAESFTNDEKPVESYELLQVNVAGKQKQTIQVRMEPENY